MKFYAVPVFVMKGFWQQELLICSDSTTKAEAIASAVMGRRLEQAGVREASKIFAVGTAVPVEDFVNKA